MYLLLTTKMCHTCKSIKHRLDMAGIPFREIPAGSEEGRKLCQDLNIREAGTLISPDKEKVSLKEVLDNVQ